MGPTTMGHLAASLAAGDSWIELWQTFFLLIIDIALIYLFFNETCRRMSADRWRMRALSENPSTKIIWALGVTYFAKFLDRTWLLLRHYQISSEIVHGAIALVALLLAVWSASCILRVFSGVVWGKRAWMWIVALATIGATVAMIAVDLVATS